ncbi:MAG TPA: hypothetical protein VF035_03225 [Longimicrobiales bacterium]
MRPERRTLRLAVAMLAFAAGAGRAAAQQTTGAGQPEIHVLFVTSAASDSSDFSAGVTRGIRFGADEAAHTAALTGARFTLATLLLPLPADSSRRMVARAGIVITAVAPSTLDSVIGPVAALVLDVTPWSSPVVCGPRVLRVSPGAAALRQARVWHPALERFGAQQLNERYRRFSNRDLDGDAWLGWLAAKLAFELPVRARTTDADSLAAFARSSRARFDGHKGRALLFDGGTGVLDQPLYQRDGVPPAEVDGPIVKPTCH